MFDSTKSSTPMVNTTLVKILDLYKKGSINANEAEKMLLTLNTQKNVDEKAAQTSWADDGKLRIVAFIGTKLLKKGEAGNHNIEVEYKGAALDVESYGNLTCGKIGGNVSAGGNINCGDIGGNLSCGGNITCNNANGNIAAGGGIRIIK